MQLDLKLIPFSRRKSRHMVYEETDNGGNGWEKGLYLAFAVETIAMFRMGASGPKGFLRIVPVFEGEKLDYTYEASVGLLVIKTIKGNITIVLDGSKILRIGGRGIGLRFEGRVGFGENVYMKKHGIEFLKGGVIYLIKPVKGEISLDSHWDLKALHATNPIIDVTPDKNAEFEIAIFDANLALELAPLSGSLETAAEESKRDFENFSADFVKTSGKYADFCSLAAYGYWMGLREDGLACANKLSNQKYYSQQVPALALPIIDPSKAIDILSAQLDTASPAGLVPVWFTDKAKLTETVPPIYACPASVILANGGLDMLQAEKLSAFYKKLSTAVGWWFSKRTNAEGLSFYAFRHESGWPEHTSFACDTPTATADLAALLVLACSSLSAMAAVLDKTNEATEWEAKAKIQHANITDKFWHKDGFVNINTTTGARCSADGLLSLFPLLIGKLLPKEITEVLVKKASAADYNSLPVIPAALVVLGLFSVDKDAAEKAAAKLMESCVAGGANDERGKGLAAGTYFNHNACAALLAVAGCLSKE